MNRLLSWIFCFTSLTGLACGEQIFCKTPEGKDVDLNTDGTWKYALQQKHAKSEKAKKFVESKLIPFGVWFDPDAWRISGKKSNEDAEFEFSLKGGDAYALMINEGVGLSYDYMKNFLLEHFNEAEGVEEGHLVHEEKRTVNGLPVTYLQFDMLIHKVPFSAVLLVYIGESETIQLMAFTTTKQLPKYQPAIEEFLNGLGKAE